MGVSVNGGTPRSSILIGFSIIFTIHFGGFPPIFGNTQMSPSFGESTIDLYPKNLSPRFTNSSRCCSASSQPFAWSMSVQQHLRPVPASAVPLVIDVSWIWKNHPLVVQPLKNEQSTVWYLKIAGHNDYTVLLPKINSSPLKMLVSNRKV